MIFVEMYLAHHYPQWNLILSLLLFYTYLSMSLKFQYKGVNKKIVVSSINTFNMLVENAKKAFNELPKDARFCFIR